MRRLSSIREAHANVDFPLIASRVHFSLADRLIFYFLFWAPRGPNEDVGTTYHTGSTRVSGNNPDILLHAIETHILCIFV